MVIDTVCGWNHTRRSNIIIYSYLLPKDSLHFERIISITNGQIYPSCHYPNRISLVHWSYLGCFILACSYQAGLVRHVPHSYNEARSIMLAMMAITVEIVIVIPAFYVSIWSRYRYLTYTLVSFFMATNTLFCVFIKIVYYVFPTMGKRKTIATWDFRRLWIDRKNVSIWWSCTLQNTANSENRKTKWNVKHSVKTPSISEVLNKYRLLQKLSP